MQMEFHENALGGIAPGDWMEGILQGMRWWNSELWNITGNSSTFQLANVSTNHIRIMVLDDPTRFGQMRLQQWWNPHVFAFDIELSGAQIAANAWDGHHPWLEYQHLHRFIASVVAHELGHALGLADRGGDSIMSTGRERNTCPGLRTIDVSNMLFLHR
jgi:hypothetical protein